jgi:DNA polymerase III delta' subunit
MQIIGHQAQHAALSGLIAARRLPPTLLFAGPQGIGKRLFAYELGRTLLCESPRDEQGRLYSCQQCKSCALYDHNNHPDLIEIPCADRDRSSTEGIREILRQLSFTSFRSKGRVLIFDGVEQLHDAASNALLKTLEEPRPNTTFFLITSSPSKVLATIRSRSQLWSFAPLSDNELVAFSKRSTLDAQAVSQVLPLAEGVPARLVELIERQEEIEALTDMLSRIARGGVAGVAELVSYVTKEKESSRAKLSLLRSLIRRALQESPHERRFALALANTIEAERLIYERHLQPQSVLTTALLPLAEHRGTFTTRSFSDILLSDISI